ncbi:MAG: NOL1/NOP2/sun family putative RNA methylase [Nanoarchaeota archaeon]|nr:NOL1/NOP2/sun family putative RNA methylase [Nanoarchaeota archaeon]
MKLKDVWIERQSEIIEDVDELEKHMFLELPVSVRINTLKAKRNEIIKRLKQKGWKLKQVPFYKDGFILKEREYAIGNTLEHFLGYIYKQEVASMIPPVVLNPKEGDVVLDMAAAPGSKTTQMAQMMKNKGVIVANERYLQRMIALRSNLQRCGVMNTIATGMDGKWFKKVPIKFDKILLDAPCTGTGIIMKSPHTAKTWSLRASIIASNLQKQLIASAISCLKEGGVLVYSTCSLEPEENEEVVNYAIKKFGVSVERIRLKDFKIRNGVVRFGKKTFFEDVKKCARIYPQDNKTSGFFVAKLRK